MSGSGDWHRYLNLGPIIVHVLACCPRRGSRNCYRRNVKKHVVRVVRVARRWKFLHHDRMVSESCWIHADWSQQRIFPSFLITINECYKRISNSLPDMVLSSSKWLLCDVVLVAPTTNNHQIAKIFYQFWPARDPSKLYQGLFYLWVCFSYGISRDLATFTHHGPLQSLTFYSLWLYIVFSFMAELLSFLNTCK